MKIFLLGIPFDALADQEVEKRALFFLKSYEGDFTSRYITSPSFQAIDDTFGYLKIEDEDLLEYYRKADLSLISNKPLIILSWFLGDPFPSQIPTTHLVSELIETLTYAKKRLFILGNDYSSVQKKAMEIVAEFPLVDIAGAFSTQMNLNGAHIENLREKDLVILNAIEQVGPDFLFLKLDKKQQAIWLERVIKDLKVPLTLGAGDKEESTFFAALLKGVKKFVKFSFFSLPLALFYQLNRFVSFFTHTQACPTLCQKNSLLFLSNRKTIEVLRLPCLLDKERVQNLYRGLSGFLELDEFIIDFKALRHLDLYGFQFLNTLFNERQKVGKGVLGINMEGDIRWLLKLNKLWDVVGDGIVRGAKEALVRLHEEESLFMSIEQDEYGVHLYFLGKLASNTKYDELLEKLLPVLSNKKLILHTEYLTKTSAYGKWFLKRLKTLSDS